VGIVFLQEGALELMLLVHLSFVQGICGIDIHLARKVLLERFSALLQLEGLVFEGHERILVLGGGEQLVFEV